MIWYVAIGSALGGVARYLLGGVVQRASGGTFPVGTLVINTAGVGALMEYNGDLYVGGSFALAGDKPAKNLAKWNGASWSTLATTPNASITGMALFKEELAISGTYWMIGADSANRAATWNGSEWKILGKGLGSGGNCLAVYNESLYSGGVGSFNGQKCISKWEGASALLPGRTRIRGAASTRFWNASGSLLFLRGETAENPMGFDLAGRGALLIPIR